MKKWQGILLALLMITLPVLSACGTLGLGSSKSKAQENYENQLKALQMQQEANQKAQEEYNKAMQDSLNQYYQAYQEYQMNMQLQQLQQEGIEYSTNQTQPVSGNQTQ